MCIKNLCTKCRKLYVEAQTKKYISLTMLLSIHVNIIFKFEIDVYTRARKENSRCLTKEVTGNLKTALFHNKPASAPLSLQPLH